MPLFILINVLLVNIKLLVYTSEVMPRIHFGYIIGFWYLIHIYYIFSPVWYVTLGHDVKREVKQIFTQPTFQRRITVVSTLRIQRCGFNRWNDVDPTLKMKQNPMSDFQRCTTLIQRGCTTLKQRWDNVETTLSQLCSNLASTLVKALSKPVRLVISTNS